MGCGCTSLSPSAAMKPTYHEDMGQEQSTKTSAQGDNWIWSIIYVLADFGGSAIASK